MNEQVVPGTGGESPQPEVKPSGAPPLRDPHLYLDGIDHEERLVIGWTAQVVDGQLRAKSYSAHDDRQPWTERPLAGVCNRCQSKGSDDLASAVAGASLPSPIAFDMSEDVVTVCREDLAAHTVIIAQSGSGKSYLLGSLLEEIVLRTRMDITILDPNGDFRKFWSADSAAIRGSGCTSKNPSYMHPLVFGYKGTDKERIDWWKGKWDGHVRGGDEKIRVPGSDVTLRDPSAPMTFFETAPTEQRMELVRPSGAIIKEPKFAWDSVSPELLAAYESKDQADLKMAARLAVIHDYVQQVGQCHCYPRDKTKQKDTKPFDSVDEVVEELRYAANSQDPTKSVAELLDRLRFADTESSALRSKGHTGAVPANDDRIASAVTRAVSTLWIDDDGERSKHVNSLIQAYIRGYRYFASTANLVDTEPGPSGAGFSKKPSDKRTISIYDLLTAPGPGRRTEIAYLALRQIWKQAAARFRDQADGGFANSSIDGTPRPPDQVDRAHRICPHLVVIDEAHNLAPSDDSTPSHPVAVLLRELITTIAAEGRKFGIHLLLVSQRPDKVSQRALSECTNQIIMRVTSDEVLSKCVRLFNLNLTEDQTKLIKGFKPGNGLLAGGWVRDATPKRQTVYFHGCGRRTHEGSPKPDNTWLANPLPPESRLYIQETSSGPKVPPSMPPEDANELRTRGNPPAANGHAERKDNPNPPLKQRKTNPGSKASGKDKSSQNSKRRGSRQSDGGIEPT